MNADLTFALGAPSRRSGHRSWEATANSERGGSILADLIGDDGYIEVGSTVSVGERDTAAEIASRANMMGYKVDWKEVAA